jgi:hypothetical protein
MSVIFVDSDILLDVILDRIPFYDSSVRILLLADQSEFSCCTAVHSLLNVHYVTKRKLGLPEADKAIKLLIGKITIVSEDQTTVDQAIQSGFTDFEDAVQFFAAKSVNADYIITRNLKDYKESTIPVLTAEQFLRTL